MRILQNILLVIGASALGLALCVGFAFLVSIAAFPPRAGEQPSLNWGSAIGFMILAVGGGILGAIAGLVGSIYWIRQGRNEHWSLTTWIGVVLGLATAQGIRASSVLDGNKLGDLVGWWPGMMLVAAAMACIGGSIGGMIAAARSPRHVSPTSKTN